MECKCSRCGEIITSPYFFQGAPFGWTCIKIVNPLAKKKKQGIKEHWIRVDSSDFIQEYKKQYVTAYWNGRKFKFWLFPSKTMDGKEFLSAHVSHIELANNGEVYINLAAYKNYSQFLKPHTATDTVKE
jgi:hypothetical protein